MHMNKLNYSNAAALVADFKAGAKFEVHRNGIAKRVVGIESYPGSAHGFQVRIEGSAGAWTAFRLDGSHTSGRQIVKVADAPAKAAATEPFDMKTFVSTGREAFVPATGEKLVSFLFAANSLEVVLEDAKGNHRVSTNYRHDGTHKWQPKRSLVFKPLPPKTRKMRLEIVKVDGTRGVFSARLLGLDGVAYVPAAIGSKVTFGAFPVKTGVTVHAHDFEVSL
jgi:hypothetical protein